MPKYAELQDEAWLRQRYETELLHYSEMAKILGCTKEAVAYSLKKFGIEIRPPVLKRVIQLEDRDWLYARYVEEKKTLKQIARLAGIGVIAFDVRNALVRHGIEVRDGKAAAKLKTCKSSYSLLNDKEWLYQKYIVEGLSTNHIAEMAGAKTANSARQAIMKAGIEMRNQSDGVTYNRKDLGLIWTPESYEVIEGSLLGDASLGIWNAESDISNPYFYKKNKHLDHVEFVAKQILEQWEKRVSLEMSTFRGVTRGYYKFSTYSHREFKEMYDRWYPTWNNRVKVIPEDLVVTPTVLLHWFMDDGCSYRRKDRPTRQICIELCTDCFSEESQIKVAKQMEDTLGISFSVAPSTNNGKRMFRLALKQSYADKFYEIIGPPPVPSLAYKWK